MSQDKFKGRKRLKRRMKRQKRVPKCCHASRAWSCALWCTKQC